MDVGNRWGVGGVALIVLRDIIFYMQKQTNKQINKQTKTARLNHTIMLQRKRCARVETLKSNDF